MVTGTFERFGDAVDTLDLSEEGYQRILKSLERDEKMWLGPERRQSPRVSPPGETMFVWEYAQKRRAAQRYLVRCRNISTGGTAFLHGEYVTPGSRCTVIMIRQNKPPVHMTGSVIYCQHLAGIVHNVGVKFDQLLDEDLCPIDTAG